MPTSRCLGYRSFIISTIVDFMARIVFIVGYRSFIISTIVDVLVFIFIAMATGLL